MGHSPAGSGRFVTGGHTLEKSSQQMTPVVPSDLGFWDSPNGKRIRGTAAGGVAGAEAQESPDTTPPRALAERRRRAGAGAAAAAVHAVRRGEANGSRDKATAARQDFTWVYDFSAALQKPTNEGRSLLIITLTTDPFSRTQRQNLRD